LASFAKKTQVLVDVYNQHYVKFPEYAPKSRANSLSRGASRDQYLAGRGSRGALSGRLSGPDRLDFACAGCLQQREALARGFLGVLEALPFVLDLEAGPFVRIDRLEVGSLELAIGDGLRREQRQVRPPDFWFGVSVWFGVSAGTCGGADGRRLAFVHYGTDFTLRRVARAAGK